jgi:hypothetical protein
MGGYGWIQMYTAYAQAYGQVGWDSGCKRIRMDIEQYLVTHLMSQPIHELKGRWIKMDMGGYGFT